MPHGKRMGPPWLNGKLSGRGYRMTMPRQTIMDVLARTTGHLSAEEIYLRVHKFHPSVGLATVYRTLDLMVQMGFVSKFDFGDGRARYELLEGPGSKRQHHHLICTSCGRVIDYAEYIDEENELLKRTEDVLSKKFNFKITSHLLQFYGLCSDCK
jgi:Fur family transcriptional regulator, ferric uptake regulator